MNDGASWEQILEIARGLDSDAAARKGVESAAAVRLARAVLALQREIERGRAHLPSGGAKPEGEPGPAIPDGE